MISPKFPKGVKSDRTGPHHYLEFPLLCSFELVVALPLGKPGIRSQIPYHQIARKNVSQSDE